MLVFSIMWNFKPILSFFLILYIKNNGFSPTKEFVSEMNYWKDARKPLGEAGGYATACS